MNRTIILASASKRRSQILASCRIRHKIAVSGVRERRDRKSDTGRLVTDNARRKAQKIAQRYKDAIIIGADTLVMMGTRLIGKPASEKEAKELLNLFSGRRIEVYTGIFLIDTSTSRKAGGYEKSLINVKRISKKDIDRYFKVLRPYDKAGGFSIEGAGSIIFDDISGSYFNILGLPMTKLANLFNKIGLDILDYPQK